MMAGRPSLKLNIHASLFNRFDGHHQEHDDRSLCCSGVARAREVVQALAEDDAFSSKRHSLRWLEVILILFVPARCPSIGPRQRMLVVFLEGIKKLPQEPVTLFDRVVRQIR